MTSLGYKGAQLDLLVRQGADFDAVSVTLQYSDGVPFNLTDCQLRGTINKAWNSAPSAEVDFTITDAPAGKFTFSISHTATAAITCGPTETVASSQYVWQADIEDASGDIVPLYWGYVSVFRELPQ